MTKPKTKTKAKTKAKPQQPKPLTYQQQLSALSKQIDKLMQEANEEKLAVRHIYMPDYFYVPGDVEDFARKLDDSSTYLFGICRQMETTMNKMLALRHIEKKAQQKRKGN